MKPPRTRAQRRALDGLLEKGIIGTAIGLVLLLAPSILKGSPLVTVVANSLRPAGWVALGVGAALVGIHTALRRYIQAVPQPEDAPVSRFQHSVLPEELLNPPSRVRLEPKREGRPAASAAPAETTLPIPDHSWGPQVLAQIEWRRFEAVCEALFAQAGFRTQAQSHGADGGVDIWLHSRHAQGPVAVVQCKHWLARPVGVKELRAFYGVMSANQLKRGTFATSGHYTPDALAFARGNGIHTLDGAGLLALIAQRTPAQQQQLLSVAFEGEYWRPTCANCGTKMVERTPAAGGAPFWGCGAFPRCRVRLPMTRCG